MQPYIAPPDTSSAPAITKRLETIYLDTACMFGTNVVPPKDEAVNALVELMQSYPPSTRFFLNCWTWGYEDLYKAVARQFQCKVRVSPYYR